MCCNHYPLWKVFEILMETKGNWRHVIRVDIFGENSRIHSRKVSPRPNVTPADNAGIWVSCSGTESQTEYSGFVNPLMFHEQCTAISFVSKIYKPTINQNAFCLQIIDANMTDEMMWLNVNHFFIITLGTCPYGYQNLWYLFTALICIDVILLINRALIFHIVQKTA